MPIARDALSLYAQIVENQSASIYSQFLSISSQHIKGDSHHYCIQMCGCRSALNNFLFSLYPHAWCIWRFFTFFTLFADKVFCAQLLQYFMQVMCFVLACLQLCLKSAMSCILQEVSRCLFAVTAVFFTLYVLWTDLECSCICRSLCFPTDASFIVIESAL